MRSVQHPVCAVIPPHMLDEIADRGDVGTRHEAESTIEQMHLLSTERVNTFIDVLPERIDRRKQRRVFDARNERRLPGLLARGEEQPESDDLEVNEAFDGAGATWDFFHQVFGRKSIDGKGLCLDSTVHYGTHFQNAMWNGHQIVYGDGDGSLFTRFTASLDVIAHELTHGLTQHATALGYSGQTGALNEHLSDAIGMMVRQFTYNETVDQSDWVIGSELLGPDVNGVGVRSMSAPGTAYDDHVLGRDPQPMHMDDYVHTTADHGGVHVNSGILNHAFYLAAKAIGGYSWEVLGRIWYVTLMERLTSNANFADFAQATHEVAGERYGFASRACRAIGEAWKAVGIRPMGVRRRRRAA
ncbi:MAG TPA: M4 family metallopeptidase [Thermoanaerobaculia bacterium]